MTNLTRDSAVTQIVELLTRYSFEIQGYTAQEIVAQWLTQSSATWVRLAVVEALYLGRYKAVSIEQILTCWHRRGNSKIHFDHEFECLICCNLPQKLAAIPNNTRSNGVNKPGTSYQREISSTNKPLHQGTSKDPNATPAAPTSKLRYSAPPVASSSLPLLNVKTPSATKVLEADQPNAGHPQVPVSRVPSSERAAFHSASASSQGRDCKSQFRSLSRPLPGEAQGGVSGDSKRVENGASKHSIDRFTPSPDASQFYFKLKAVAQQTTK